MSTERAVGLSAEQFAAEFPFHLLVDAQDRIRQTGSSLARLMPAGSSVFADRFRAVRPQIDPSFAGLAAKAGKLVVLESKFEPNVRLRGSVQLLEDGSGVLLLMSPWITRLEDIETLGLTMTDFAAHDPAIDLLFLQQANVTALEDTRRLAAMLKERTLSLDSISALSPDGIILFGPDGRAVYVNPALGRLMGESTSFFMDMTESTFIGFLSTLLDFGQLLPDFDVLATSDTGSEKGNERRRYPRATFTIVQPERRVLSCSVRRGEDASRVLYFRDITRETEVDRMKSEFLSTAAHELRTPMASVFGFSELLLRREYDETTRKDLLSTIHRQAGALIHMVNELLDLARIEARAGKDFRIAVQPLKPIVENTVASLLVPNDPRKIVVDIPDEMPDCAVDAEKLQQALTNLLSNAYKYSPDGGEIRLDTLRSADGARIGIRVTDQGMGMTPEQLSRCFERFYRADASGNIPGTGLGLALVKEIAEIFGGTIDIESTFGRGTSCVLWLPVGEGNVIRVA